MFRLAGRSKKQRRRCYVFAMGEDHHICRFWGLDSDSDDALLPGLKQVIFVSVLADLFCDVQLEV